MTANSILDLSARISANTAKLNEYILANNLPTPSFDIDGPRASPVPKHEHDIEKIRICILEDTAELQRLVLGPREFLMSNSVGQALNETFPHTDLQGIGK
jgi:hypothetical protein